MGFIAGVFTDSLFFWGTQYHGWEMMGVIPGQLRIIHQKAWAILESSPYLHHDSDVATVGTSTVDFGGEIPRFVGEVPRP